MATFALGAVAGGTAFAAGGELVSIVDSDKARRGAKVDSAGRLSVSSADAATRPFLRGNLLTKGSAQLVPPTKDKVALSQISVSNPFQQYDAKTVSVVLYQVAGSEGDYCNGPSRAIGVFQVPAGQTVFDSPAAPFMLRPPPGFSHWCLQAYLEIVGSNYYLPHISLRGHIVAGKSLAGVYVKNSPEELLTGEGGWPHTEGQ